jgi:outer membrane protein OmpA-like peptidoglycan-associated protein
MKPRSDKNAILVLALILLSSFAYPQTKDKRIFNDSTVRVSEMKNSIHSGFGPTVINGTLFFTTFKDTIKGKTNNKRGKKEYYDLYKTEIDKQGNPVSVRQPLNEVVTPYNDGPLTWCEKTGELFVTQNYIDPSVKRKPFQDEIIRLKIIIAKQINGKWEKVGDFPYFNAKYSVGHPAVTESGDTLLFSSDMPGGYGATDLYYSVRKNGKWEVPVNLGPKINTAGKEEFAYLTDRRFDGSFLIFSSTGRKGEGGLDLYYTRFPSDYSEIGHFESPINSKSDDFAMTIPAGAEFGYFTSNRAGKGEDDIYKFTFERIKKSQEKPKEVPQIVKDTTRSIPVLVLPTNQKIVLRNIYYDFDKWDILPESAKELDKLAEFMKANPQYTVLLGSHTDIRGSEQYNLKLSQLRAKAAVEYIISKGIDKSKIVGTGYGETQPINKCPENQPCTPAQHRENRRTEIFIPEILKGEPVKQEKGDYSDGRPDHSTNPGSPKGIEAELINRNKSNYSAADRVNYYLILNSFKEESNASEYVRLLNTEGYKATILTDPGSYRVGIGYTRFSQAKKALEDLKGKEMNGWILQSI